MKKKYLTLIFALIYIHQANAQYATKKVKETHEAYTDSIKQVKYDNIFPLMGQKAYSKGFDIPYPTGIMVNYLYVKQGLVIDNMQLGIKTDNINLPLTGVDFIEFDNNYTSANTVMVRPDLWIFPFLNIYGLFGRGTSTTEVNIKSPVELKSIVEQNLTSNGFGLTAAGGVGPVWLALDWNMTWNKPELLDKAVVVKTSGIRMGHNFVNKAKPFRNFGVWIGAMNVNLGGLTVGEIKLIDALPEETWDRADQIVSSYDEWYNNTATIAQKKIADQTLGPIVDAIGSADGSSVIRYGLNKAPKEKWNGVIGGQFQYNKNWTFRVEGGVLGDRRSILVSANYRFLL